MQVKLLLSGLNMVKYPLPHRGELPETMAGNYAGPGSRRTQTLGVPAHNGEVHCGSTALLTQPSMREGDALDFAGGVLSACALGIFLEREVFGHGPKEGLHARKPRLSDLFQGNLLQRALAAASSKTLGVFGASLLGGNHSSPISLWHFGVVLLPVILPHLRKDMTRDCGPHLFGNSKRAQGAFPKPLCGTSLHLAYLGAPKGPRKRGAAMMAIVVLRVEQPEVRKTFGGTGEGTNTAAKDPIGRPEDGGTMRARRKFPALHRRFELTTREIVTVGVAKVRSASIWHTTGRDINPTAGVTRRLGHPWHLARRGTSTDL